MKHHRLTLFLIQWLPFDSRASARLRSRLEEREKGRQGLAGIGEARTATLAKDRAPRSEDLWPRLASELRSGPPHAKDRRSRLRLRWAFGTAGALAAVLCGILVLTPRRTVDVGPLVKLRIDSVTIYGQPAQAFVFQTRDAGSTFVWVEKQDSGQGEMK